MTYVVVVSTPGQEVRVAGPYRHEGRAEGVRASIEALLAGTTATVVPCLPVEAWTRGLRQPAEGSPCRWRPTRCETPSGLCLVDCSSTGLSPVVD